MKKRASFTPHSISYPPVYKIKLIKLSELEKLYSEIILQNATLAEVNQCMVDYVTKLIEPTGWKAIWRTTESGVNSPGIVCDFVVQVLDVARSSLEALVTIQDILYPCLDGPDLSCEERAKVEKLMKEKVVNVSLAELYVINETDNSDEYSVTALVIEHVRFFYKHIWRPWDDVIARPTDLAFAEEFLSDRLRLHFDITTGSVPASIVERVHYLLEEGARLKPRLDELNRKMDNANQGLEGGDWGINEEINVNDIDLYESLRLRMKLEDFDVEMRRLEDPILRRIVVKDGVPQEYDGLEKVHVLAPQFNLQVLEKVTSFLKVNQGTDSSLNSNSNSKSESPPLVFHQSFPSALKDVKSGDKMIILPGKYCCDTLMWITKSISIQGLGTNRDDVVLESSDSTGDIFLHCSADNVQIGNITLRTKDATQGLVQVHFGRALFKECILDGGQCRTSSSGQLSLIECTVPHAYTLTEGTGSSITVSSENTRQSDGCCKHQP